MKSMRFLTPPKSFLLLLVCMLLLTSAAFAREEDPVRYVLTLETSQQPLETAVIAFDGSTLTYVTSFRRGGKTLYRLRLGFFASREDAETMRPYFLKQYPAAWVTRVSKREKKSVMAGTISSQSTIAKTAGNQIGN